MPEASECVSSGKQAQDSSDSGQAAGNSLYWRAWQWMPQKAEAKQSAASQEAKQGLVYLLDPTCTIKRCQSTHQTDVFTPTLLVTPENPNPDPLCSLVLTKITYTYRALILHFNTLVFMLQYLTHTNIQCYPREQWETSVRKFNIGVVFIFESLVIAFPSIDLVFQPTWAASVADLPSIPPEIYHSTTDFLLLVAGWIETILLKPSYVRACNYSWLQRHFLWHWSLHHYGIVFFWLLSLTRLVWRASLWAFIPMLHGVNVTSAPIVRSLLQPCIHNGVLAPTTDQRLRYADWLYVWAKERTALPLRMAELVDKYHLKLEELAALDKFFGADIWTSFDERKSCVQDDPITVLYRKWNLLSAPTMLIPDFYSSLLLPQAEFRGKRSSHRPTFSFHGPKEMWSITDNFPANSQWSSKSNKKNSGKAVKCTGAKRESRFFKTMSSPLWVSQLDLWSIVALVILSTLGLLHNFSSVAVCKGDLAIPRFHEEQDSDNSDSMLSITVDDKGALIFPTMDFNAIAPENLRQILKECFERCWMDGSHPVDTHSIPWEELTSDPSKFYNIEKFVFPSPLKDPVAYSATENWPLQTSSLLSRILGRDTVKEASRIITVESTPLVVNTPLPPPSESPKKKRSKKNIEQDDQAAAEDVCPKKKEKRARANPCKVGFFTESALKTTTVKSGRGWVIVTEDEEEA
ncbi:hypothetical protein C8R43DRAFT_956022 [Mycena crocata]|nr:hypothetical protein C8R43DRAFT_964956 [Mycena crocata]KAJ7108083.1 hypothetical protein C8R43DRAFT_962993 [Mycena crocata]KAJ7117418.1 hypothetical protein C8R43DRAFT_960692 [Mycena crocata]KAJ7126482.1 hypothetical protein C8R43DRAFT_958214 [Mycena crocata]KAJ7128840.1 hypothetical protein C8R43DRAFT_957613 [Mycena crocata]